MMRRKGRRRVVSCPNYFSHVEGKNSLGTRLGRGRDEKEGEEGRWEVNERSTKKRNSEEGGKGV